MENGKIGSAALSDADFRRLAAYIESELINMIDAVTTNKTDFFR